MPRLPGFVSPVLKSRVLNAMNNLLIFIFAAGCGAAVGLVIHGLLRAKRLRKLGFTGRELFSKEQFYRKLAKITVEKLPQEISFKPIESHHWSNSSAYARSIATLEALGFERQHVFMASPQKWVVEMWLSSNDGLFAAILDCPPSGGVHTEMVVEYKDGSTASFENTDECGQQHLQKHDWIHCGPISADKLLQRALQDRRPDYVGYMQLADCLRAYERAVNENLAWRRQIGYTPDEIKRLHQRARSGRRLMTKLS